jgi:hypothetical protein
LKFPNGNTYETYCPVCFPCYVSHLNVHITADMRLLRLLIIYGLTKTPMMLVTNNLGKQRGRISLFSLSAKGFSHKCHADPRNADELGE